MKKIKKILPLLLGVMVLMFGTLTVSAADVKEIASINDELMENAFAKYRSERRLSSDVTLYAVKYSNGIYVSQRPFVVYQNMIYYDLSVYPTAFMHVYSDNSITSYSTVASIYADSEGIPNSEIYRRCSTALATSCSSSHDLYDIDGKMVFHLPVVPEPPVAKVAEELPEVVQNQTKVILTTAVVCLALLVILSVLLKKLPRFLNR